MLNNIYNTNTNTNTNTNNVLVKSVYLTAMYRCDQNMKNRRDQEILG